MNSAMEYFDIGYFNPDIRRSVPERKLANRVAAWRLDEGYYDGERENGYGGFIYDGRWKTLIPKLAERYRLDAGSSVLDVGCKKGFFLHDLHQCFPGITAKGVESHPYPIETAMADVRGDISLAPYTELPFADDSFDFVLAFSSIYMLNLGDVVTALREIERVGRGKSYITLGAYATNEERRMFEKWTLLGTTLLHVDEWRELFDIVGYTGDYYFTTAGSLNLTDD